MKQQFIEWAPRADAQRDVAHAITICQEYQRMGYNLTLRQLYYQFVARGLTPNTMRSYKRLGSIVDNARLAGLLDWNYIEDRTRNVYRTDGADTSPQDAVRAIADGYRLPRWDNQPNHVEVWVEKEALTGIVSRAAGEMGVNYFACRGYVSQSEMYASAMRMARLARRGKTCTILHLGDHDPSGMDMTRDIVARMELFAGRRAPEVRRIALNMDQVEEHNPPPNPAKQTDARFAEYEAEFGDESWELDALPPDLLHDLIVDEVAALRDDAAWAAVEQREAAEREQLTAVSENWDTVLEAVGA